MIYFDGERFIVRAKDKYVIYNWYPKTNKLVTIDSKQIEKYTVDQIVDWSETRVVTGYKLITVVFTARIINEV